MLRPEGKRVEIEMDGKSSLVAISLSCSLVSLKLRPESARSGFLGGGEWVEASNSYM